MVKLKQVDDLILLPEVTEDAVVNTIKDRYLANQIHTYIGNVLVVVNPYQSLNCYGKAEIKKYMNRYIYENPPHIYAIAEEAYYSLLNEGENQCIIISGESGAGKTYNARIVMQYIASVTGKSHGSKVEQINEALLASNPVLEAFGNAKTVRNDNSSRFGKYFEILFDYGGRPVGGKISQYLLEKIRVVNPAQDERSFHIFYFMLSGLSSREKENLYLTSAADYPWISGCVKIKGTDDAKEFEIVKNAMSKFGIDSTEQEKIWRVLSAILNLSLVCFKENEKGNAEVDDTAVTDIIAHLLKVDAHTLSTALTHRTVSTGLRRGSAYQSPLTVTQAYDTRDSLAKNMYSALFAWLVGRINLSIRVDSYACSIGLLDIFGYEVFDNNSLEQMFINYVNERLQQIFIQLTLKSEQEEYRKENIEWVEIPYFDNQPCVELVEKRGGVLSILDEESIFPQGTDDSFLNKLDGALTRNERFKRVVEKGGVKTSMFTVSHYAGDVTYNTVGWLEKNRDTLYEDIKELARCSEIDIVAAFFPRPPRKNRSRPPTSGSQFKTQVTELMSTLMATHPHYIRCIKPNEEKRACDYNMERCRHQIQYLGLLEQTRVRRAGYAYRATFERFFQRYRIIAAATYPRWDKSLKDATVAILDSLKVSHDAYQLGLSKVFLRKSELLFELEEKREMKLHEVAKTIQKMWRACRGATFYAKLRRRRILHGNKERNAMTMFLRFKGVYLPDWATGGSKSAPFLKKFGGGDKIVYFAALVKKVNNSGKMQDRICLLTDKAIYNIAQGGLFSFGSPLKRRIPLENISAVTVSSKADDFMILHVQNAYDMVYTTSHRTEFLLSINELLKNNFSKDLNVVFSDEITFNARKGRTENYEPNQFAVSVDTALPSFTQKVTFSNKTIKVVVAKGVMQEKSSGISSPKAPAGPTHALARKGKGEPLCRAEATQKNEGVRTGDLPFAVGDVITITAKRGRQWEGSCNGRSGTFDSLKVRVLDETTSTTSRSSAAAPPPRAAPKATHVAIYDYAAQASDEVSFITGDKMSVVSESGDGWGLVRLVGGKEGQAPLNYLKPA